MVIQDKLEPAILHTYHSLASITLRSRENVLNNVYKLQHAKHVHKNMNVHQRM